MQDIYLYRRFSNDEQERGDSLARQLKLSKDAVEARGWEITEILTDKGRSAFLGEHLAPDSALGGFLARFDRGEIAPGSILVAEKLDRLSRRPVAEAMSWLHSLTSRGLNIMIIDKAKIFTAKMTFEEFMTTALSFAVGHEESQKKSDRTRSGMAALWRDAETKTGRWTNLAFHPPGWLIRRPDRWDIDQQRADAVREMYQLSANGLGVVKIAQRLNEQGIKPWGGTGDREKWSRSSVRQILALPAVEGDFVPVLGMFAGQRLVGYYPRIVSAYVVVQARAEQAKRSSTYRRSGRIAPTGSANLFAITCGVCGCKAHLSSSVSKSKRYAYVRCERSAEGRCSNTDYYRYESFEATALDICLDLALDDRFFELSGELRTAQQRHAEIEKAVGDKRHARARLLAMFEAGDDQVVERIRIIKGEIDSLMAELAEARAEIDRASGKADAVEHLRRVDDIRSAAASTDPLVREHARAKLRVAFHNIINSVEIERDGEGRKIFTVAFLGGVLAVRIETTGRVIKMISEASGEPLYRFAPESEALSPLIRRIKALTE